MIQQTLAPAADAEASFEETAPRMHPAGAPRTRLVVDPPGGWPTIDVSELWAYRGLLFYFLWRDLKVRYAQSVLGRGWAFISPLMTMVIFTVIFGTFAGIPSDGVPYPVFSFAALVPWGFFAGAFTGARSSLASNSSFLTKIYFPRLILPLSTVLSGLPNLGVSLSILLAMQVAYGIVPSVEAIVVLPLLILVMALTATGLGAAVASIQVQYRDAGAIAGFATQAWMYASPVVYPLSLVPEQYRTVYMLNPMVAVIEGFRAVLLRTQPVDWSSIAVALVVSSLLFFAGLLFFRKLEDRFADVV